MTVAPPHASNEVLTLTEALQAFTAPNADKRDTFKRLHAAMQTPVDGSHVERTNAEQQALTQAVMLAADDNSSASLKWIDDSKGWGLVATRDISQDELILTVPSSSISITHAQAVKSSLGRKLLQDPLVSGNPSVMLALYLISQVDDPTDPLTASYIQLLPRSFYTPLWYNWSEVEFLDGTFIYEKIRKMYEQLAKQFLYLHRFLGAGTVQDFTFSSFKWAMSVVMTRQNFIRNAQGESILALIPLWDMCNHASGPVSTHFDIQLDRLEFNAMNAFKQGQEISMSYGNRPSADMLMYSGFVPDECVNDFLAVAVPLPASIDARDERISKLEQELDAYTYRNTNEVLIYDNLKQCEGLLIFVRALVSSVQELQLPLASTDVPAINQDLWKAREEKVFKWVRLKITVLLRLLDKTEPKISEDSWCAQQAILFRGKQRRILQSLQESMK